MKHGFNPRRIPARAQRGNLLAGSLAFLLLALSVLGCATTYSSPLPTSPLQPAITIYVGSG
ncbi:hypothetical protein [Geomonas oryzisoli]